MNRGKLATLIMGAALATGIVGIGTSNTHINEKTQKTSNSVLLTNTNSKAGNADAVDGNHNKMKQGRLNLTVKNKDTGKVLANTTVEINGQKYKTNANGEIEGLSLWTVEQKLTVGADGFDSGIITVTTKADSTISETVELAPVQKEAHINLKVVDVQTGKAMVNAKVTVGGSEMTTNSEGVIKGIPCWANVDQHISVTAKGYQISYLDFKPEPDKTYDETVKIAPITASEIVTVVNGKTGEALKDTNVNIGGVDLKTDSTGKVKLDGLWAGKQDFTVKVNNYKDGNVTFEAVAGEIGHVTVKVMPIEQQGRLNLTIKNKDTGKVLANTTVEINGQKYKTNTNGEIEGLSLWTVEQKLTVGADGFNSGVITVTTNADSTTSKTIELAPVQKEAHINLRVVDVQTGDVMKNAKVIVGGSEMTTNSEGVIEGIPCWANVDQHISVTAKGYQTSYLDFKPEADKTYDETVKIAPITASEIVTVINGKTGEALKDTNVNIGGVDLKTDSTGKVKLDGLWAGKQDFTVKVNNYKDGNVTFEAVAGEIGHTTVKVMPKEQGRVNLTIKDKTTGKVFGNTTIEINGQKFTTNENGVVEGLSLWEGPQQLTIAVDGFKTETITVNTNPGHEISEIINLVSTK